MSPLIFVLIHEIIWSLNPIRLDKIRNPKLETRNKFESQMSEIQNVLKIRILNFEIVSDFGFSASDFRFGER
jgi:hypothetical protein